MWPFRKSKTSSTIFKPDFTFAPPVRTPPPRSDSLSFSMQLSPGTRSKHSVDPFEKAVSEPNDDGSIVISRPASKEPELSYLRSPPMSARYEEQDSEEEDSDDGTGSFICNDADSVYSVASTEIQVVSYQQITKKRVPQPIWTSPSPPGSRGSNRSGLLSPIRITTKPADEEKTGWKALNKCATSEGIELQLRAQELLRDSPSDDLVQEEDSFVNDTAWLADKSPSTIRKPSTTSTFGTFGPRNVRMSFSSFHTAQPATSWFALDSAVSTPVTEERQSWLPAPPRHSNLSEGLSELLQFDSTFTTESTRNSMNSDHHHSLAPPPLSHSTNPSSSSTPLDCPTPENRSSIIAAPAYQIEDSLAKLNEICAREFTVDGIDSLLRPKSAGSDGGYGALRWEDDMDANSGSLDTFLLD